MAFLRKKPSGVSLVSQAASDTILRKKPSAMSLVSQAASDASKKPISLAKRIMHRLRRSQSMCLDVPKRDHISLPLSGTAVDVWRGHTLDSMESLVPLNVLKHVPPSPTTTPLSPEDIFEPRRPSQLEFEDPFMFDEILSRMHQAGRMKRSTSGSQKQVRFTKALHDSGDGQFRPLSPVLEEHFPWRSVHGDT